MKNERMVTRKLFISCILILCIIFITIIVLQREYYKGKINQNNEIERQFTIVEENDTDLQNIKAK